VCHNAGLVSWALPFQHLLAMRALTMNINAKLLRPGTPHRNWEYISGEYAQLCDIVRYCANRKHCPLPLLPLPAWCQKPREPGPWPASTWHRTSPSACEPAVSSGMRLGKSVLTIITRENNCIPHEHNALSTTNFSLLTTHS